MDTNGSHPLDVLINRILDLDALERAELFAVLTEGGDASDKVGFDAAFASDLAGLSVVDRHLLAFRLFHKDVTLGDNIARLDHRRAISALAKVATIELVDDCPNAYHPLIRLRGLLRDHPDGWSLVPGELQAHSALAVVNPNRSRGVSSHSAYLEGGPTPPSQHNTWASAHQSSESPSSRHYSKPVVDKWLDPPRQSGRQPRSERASGMNGTNLYHITHSRNIRSIAEQGRIWCENSRLQRGIEPHSIAYANIQEKRAVWQVDCPPGGMLHDYAPFYFAHRTPMLFTISRGNVEGSKQEDVVYLVTTLDQITHAGLQFVYTDGQGNTANSQFFNDAALDQLDWVAIDATWWRNTDEDPDLMRRKQSEFLVHRSCPWELITEIGVMLPKAREDVLDQLSGMLHIPKVFVRPNWYY